MLRRQVGAPLWFTQTLPLKCLIPHLEQRRVITSQVVCLCVCNQSTDVVDWLLISVTVKRQFVSTYASCISLIKNPHNYIR